MIRELQPGILINDRLPGRRRLQDARAVRPRAAARRPLGDLHDDERELGLQPAPTRTGSHARTLVQTLCEVAGRGGNLLLNVGPMGDGRLPPEIAERLAAIEPWMARNGESIIGTTPGLEPWQCYGSSTKRGDTVYVHLLMRPYDTVTVRGVRIKKLRSVRALSTGAALEFTHAHRHHRISAPGSRSAKSRSPCPKARSTSTRPCSRWSSSQAWSTAHSPARSGSANSACFGPRRCAARICIPRIAIRHAVAASTPEERRNSRNPGGGAPAHPSPLKRATKTGESRSPGRRLDAPSYPPQLDVGLAVQSGRRGEFPAMAVMESSRIACATASSGHSDRPALWLAALRSPKDR